MWLRPLGEDSEDLNFSEYLFARVACPGGLHRQDRKRRRDTVGLRSPRAAPPAARELADQ
jgi:hypothetical protein